MSSPTYQQVLSLLEKLSISPETGSVFKPGLAYARLRIQDMLSEQADTIGDDSVTDTLRAVTEARRDLHESLIHLPAWDADRARDLIRVLEQRVAEHTRTENSPV